MDWPSIVENPDIPLIVTEGEVKALSAAAQGIPTVAIGGVSNIYDVKSGGLLPDLEIIAAGGRRVIVAFDSDVSTKPEVRMALSRLCRELSGAGADVRVAYLPDGKDGSKLGLDDYIVKHAGEQLTELLLEAQPLASRDLYAISLSPKRLLENLDILDEAFCASELHVYERSGQMVLVQNTNAPTEIDGVMRRESVPLINEVSVPVCQQLAMSASRFERWSGDPPKPKETECPASFARHYLEKANGRKLPFLKAIARAPTMTMDGTIIQKPGYHGGSGVLYIPGHTFPFIQDEPTATDAREALQALKHVVRGFEFANEASLSVWLAALLTAIVRPALRTAPMFGFSAPAMGSGKTLAADLVALIATGTQPAVMSQGRSADEDRKRYLAVLLRGDPIIQIDNVEQAIEGDALCSILTSPTWQERVLGRSETVTVETNATWLATGNNLRFEGDMSTRALLCRINPNNERPEERTYSWDARKEVLEQRGLLVVAALTIIRAYSVAGRPDMGAKAFGRFEDWQAMVQAPLMWAGAADPCVTRSMIETGDAVREELAEFLTLWDVVFGARDVRAKEFLGLKDVPIVEALPQHLASLNQAKHDLYSLACDVTGCRTDALSVKSLGQWLARQQDRQCDGKRIVRSVDKKSKMAIWRLGQ